MFIALMNFTDEEDPLLSCPSDVLNNTDSGLNTANVTWPDATATDNSGSVTVTSSINSGATFILGTTNVTYTAIDPSGNSVMCTFSVTVVGECFSLNNAG